MGFSRQQALKQETAVRYIDMFSMPNIRAVGNLTARPKRRKSIRAPACLALILIPSLSSAAIFKCTAEDGSITYTDAPCPADMTTQYIDPAAPPSLNEPAQTMNTSAALPEMTYESQPEILAILCANDEFTVWLKAQRHGLPERDVRKAKFIRLSILCRRAMHLADVAPQMLQMPSENVLGQYMRPRPILSRN
jgi:hypothetical protein